jgi:glycerophosphoryl diester phosphodiesterase
MHFRKYMKRPLGIIVLSLFLMVQCKKEEIPSDDNFLGSKVMILGHRGMGIGYKMPGNTLEAIIPALAIGADGCEIDVQMTSDSVLVLFHDDELDVPTTCTGRIYESKWDEIQECKYYAIKNNIFINSLDTVFSHIPNLNDYYFSFDCTKIEDEIQDFDGFLDQYLRAIDKICLKYNMSDHVFLEGSPLVLNRAKELGLTNKLFLFGYMDAGGIDNAVNSGYCGLSICADWMYTGADSAHEKGLYVMLWSPDNLSENEEALNLKVDIIQTDDPISILKLLNRYNYEYQIP